MYNNFVVEGDKMAAEIIQHQTLSIEGIYALEKWITQNHALLAPHITNLHTVSPKELGRISGLKTPNQVLMVCKQPNYRLDAAIINSSLTLFLDDIQNPGNMGSILRIADWYGLPYVFCSKNTVELYNPKVIQASMGAIFRVRSLASDFDDLIAQFPKLPTYAAVLDGENIFQKTIEPQGLLVIGNEGAGVSPNILEKINHKISIPKAKNGGAESLNAAVATGIICAAFMKNL